MSLCGNPECTLTDVQHVVVKNAEDIAMAGMMELKSAVNRGEIEPGSAAIMVSGIIYGTALETGIRLALMDKIGAEKLLEHFDAHSAIVGGVLEEANQIIAEDGRQLLETLARSTS